MIIGTLWLLFQIAGPFFVGSLPLYQESYYFFGSILGPLITGNSHIGIVVGHGIYGPDLVFHLVLRRGGGASKHCSTQAAAQVPKYPNMRSVGFLCLGILTMVLCRYLTFDLDPWTPRGPSPQKPGAVGGQFMTLSRACGARRLRVDS